MPESELITLRDLLRWSISKFNAAELSFGHGNDNSWDEAVYLLLHTLNLPLDTLEPFLDARLLSGERQKCIDIINERIQTKKPAAYLTKEAWLQGLRFICDERAIIPRSPIAELLNEGLEPWIADPEAIGSVLDLCTGSACLAILAAYVFPNAMVDAIDISQTALSLAQENISLHRLEDRLNLYKNDLLKDFDNTKSYDLILCNPPYVSQDSMSKLPSEYLHEPDNALAGGVDGMDLVRQILARVSLYLNDNGILVLEIGHEKQHFERAFPKLNPIWLSTQNSSEQILLLNKSQLI